MPAGRNLEVAKAMLLWIRSSIDFETMSAYSYLGAIHILSVSGLHVGLLYVGLSFLLGFLLRRGKWGRLIFFTLMLLILWMYAGISGFSAPVLRSAWMFSVMLYASSFGERHHSINTLAFSAIGGSKCVGSTRIPTVLFSRLRSHVIPIKTCELENLSIFK
jgi:competence protein ComEC